MTHPFEPKIIAWLQSKMKRDYSDEYEVVSKADPAYRHVYTTCFTELEIENGGFEQYFENSIGQLGLEALQAYQAMGAKHCGRVLSEAIAIFKKKSPNQTLYPHRGRWEWKRPFKPDPQLNKLSDTFYDAMAEDKTDGLRSAYIAANLEKYRDLK